MQLPQIHEQQNRSQDNLYPLCTTLPDYGFQVRWVTTNEVSEELIQKTNDLFFSI